MYINTEQRIWKRVKKGAPDECWPWIGCRDKLGYGFLTIGGKRKLAHRVIWTLVNGRVTTGLRILHSCDNPPCCNPNHLREGTPADNMRDMVERGRSARGERNHYSKLTDAQVVEILQLLKEGHSQSHIARLYSVAPSSINLISTNKKWKHIPRQAVNSLDVQEADRVQ